MRSLLDRNGISWTHLVSPSKQEVRALESKYDIHELIVEDLTELNTQDKIDFYDNHLCIVLHFPKYEDSTKRYILNELNVVLGKEYLVTTTRFDTHIIMEAKNLYLEELDDIDEHDEEEKFRITPYYILYEILESIYEKNINLLQKIGRDIIEIEESLLKKQPITSSIISELLIKKRNISFLKSTYSTHEEILSEISDMLPKIYEEDLNVYFEDLITKVKKITVNIATLQENIESIADTYNSLVTLKANDTMMILTIITGITMPFALITSLFSINVKLPLSNTNPLSFWILTLIMSGLSGAFAYFFLKRK